MSNDTRETNLVTVNYERKVGTLFSFLLKTTCHPGVKKTTIVMACTALFQISSQKSSTLSKPLMLMLRRQGGDTKPFVSLSVQEGHETWDIFRRGWIW